VRDKLGKETTKRGTQRSNGHVNRFLAVLSDAFTYAKKELRW